MGIIGKNDKLVIDREVSQPRESKLLHTHVVGASGTGKSEFLLNQITQDIEQGEGVALIDPHGDLSQRVLERVPEGRVHDVVYFNAADFDRPIGLNPLSGSDPDDYPRVASSILYALKAIWGDTWGESRMQFLLLNTLLPLLEYGNTSLLSVQRFLTDEAYRSQVLANTKNPAVFWYWTTVFDKYKKQEKDQYTAPIHHHLGQLGSDFALRNILGQVKDTISVKDIMSERKIFIANLSKGHIGHVNANFLGSLLVAFYALAAQERAKLAELERQAYFLYVDEFPSFTTESFGDILSEARKYGLGLTLAHQYFGQLLEAVKQSVLGNSGTLVSFRVGPEDAGILSRATGEPSPVFSALDRFKAFVRMEEAGEVLPYHIQTTPAGEGSSERRARIEHESRIRYGTPRGEIEDKLRRLYQ